MLVLGCDAPIGGPTKLLRKVFFVPPEQKSVPTIYTAAVDLKHGARIVAVYGERIMLYSVAPDIISDSRREQEAIAAMSTAEIATLATQPTDNHWRNWWSDRVPCDATRSIDFETSASLWPIFVRGTEIGKLKGICEIAVQTQPDLAIWAFTNFLQCRTWRLRNYASPVVRTEHFICRDGGMHDLPATDGCQDVVMGNTHANPRICPRSPCDRQHPNYTAEQLPVPSLDGQASGNSKRMSKALAIKNDDWVDFLDIRGCSDAWYDGDGDVVMFYGP